MNNRFKTIHINNAIDPSQRCKSNRLLIRLSMSQNRFARRPTSTYQPQENGLLSIKGMYNLCES